MLRPLRAPGRGALVGEAARMCNITPRAIRFYEEEGLVSGARGGGGQRLFDEAALDRLRFIAEARTLGLSVGEVRELLEIGDKHGSQRQRERLLQGCERRLAELDEQRRLVERALHNLTQSPPSANLRMAG